MTCLPAIVFVRKSGKTLARAFEQSMPKCLKTSEKQDAFKNGVGKKLQIQNSKLKRSTRSQTPNTKLQARGAGRALEIGTWDFFGVWSLVFGVSIRRFLWFLVFRSAAAQKLRCAPHSGPKKLFLAFLQERRQPVFPATKP